jgi:lipopolysaccharide export system permease protein
MSGATHRILQRYVLREVALVWLALTPILVIILLAKRFTYYLSLAAAGELPIDAAYQLILLKIPSHLGVILPLTLFLSILLALGRMYRDSEMIAYAASGVSPWRVLMGIAGVGVFAFILSAVTTLYFSPWAQNQAVIVNANVDQEGDFLGLLPGRFNELNEDGRVIYTESITNDRSRMREVFIFDGNDERMTVIRSEFGLKNREQESGASYLVLLNGSRLSGQPGSKELQVIEYGRHDIRVSSGSPIAANAGISGMPTLALFHRPDEAPFQAELQWRISVPLSVLVLVFVGVPLAKSSPRQGRFAVLLPGVLIYLLYSNLISISKTWVAQADLPAFPGIFWVHVVFLFLGITMTWKETRARPRKDGITFTPSKRERNVT